MNDTSVDRHLDEIIRQARAAKGEDTDMTPWDFQIPTANELYNLREGCGLSREQVSERIGYGETTVQAIETGHAAPGRQFIQKALRLYKMEWPRLE